MISVIMPVYNGEKYLREAIDSILNQTFTDFEFIILNDGSIDRTEEIILSYNDPRIVYIKNKENLQIVKTLNKGIGLARGKYIARMDADDISLPIRFEKQIKYMEKNPQIGVCGTWLQTFGTRHEKWKMPVSHNGIIMRMLFHSSLMHATVFFRKSMIMPYKKIYNEAFNKAEDYELWIRLSDKIEFANIPEILYYYRIDDTAKKRQKYKQEQKNLANIIREKYLDMNDFHYTNDELLLHNSLAYRDYDISGSIVDTKDWLLRLYDMNRDNEFVPAKICKKVLVEIFYNACSRLLSREETNRIFNDFLKEINSLSLEFRIKLFLKSMAASQREKI